jgi:hypothetical protein
MQVAFTEFELYRVTSRRLPAAIALTGLPLEVEVS